MHNDAINVINSGGTLSEGYFQGVGSTDVQVCFVAGTPILLADGTSKPIEDIQIGDEVYARPHGNPTGDLLKCKVVRTFTNEKDSWSLTAENVATHERITVRGTAEHPFFVQDKGWTSLGELAIGDKLVSASGETLIVVAKEHHPETVAVYNFEVEQAHTYFVGKTLEQSLLVHNDCSTCGKSGWLPHGLLGMCPQNLQDIKNERGLTGLSAIDGVVTHDNAHVPEMTIEFAKTLPLASQVINTDTLISDEATAGEKFGAAASLALDFAGLLGSAANRADDFRTAAKGAKTNAKKGVAEVVDNSPRQVNAIKNLATDLGSNVGKTMNNSGPRTTELASDKLIESVKRKGRTVVIAKEGSQEMKYLDYMRANANVGGENLDHILLRPNATKVEVLEEFLHGTQKKVGAIDKHGVLECEIRVKEFMIRHSKLLGLLQEDVEILGIMIKGIR